MQTRLRGEGQTSLKTFAVIDLYERLCKLGTGMQQWPGILTEQFMRCGCGGYMFVNSASCRDWEYQDPIVLMMFPIPAALLREAQYEHCLWLAV